MGSCRAVLLLALLCGAAARDCTKDDYNQLLTPCEKAPDGTKKRSEIYYPTVECDPVAGVTPQNKYGLDCDCPEGAYRATDGDCLQCKPGEFSPAGLHYGYEDWSHWPAPSQQSDKFFVPAEGWTVYCDGEGCNPWTPDATNQSISSGDNWDHHNIRSVIVIVKEFTREKNYVRFTYRVDAETCHNTVFRCDGLSFYVDGQQQLPKPPAFVKSDQPQFTPFELEIPPGLHTLKWVYEKDSGVQDGEDVAYISSITLVGAENEQHQYSSECHSCPPGSFSDEKGQAECKLCNWFEYQPSSNKTSCETCRPGQISAPGATECRLLPNCTKDDYYTTRSPPKQCQKVGDDFMYTETSFWETFFVGGQEKQLCNPTPQVIKPTTKPNAGVCVCQPGMELDTSATAVTGCSNCAPQTYNEGTNVSKCSPCPSGTVSVPGRFFDRFDFDEVPSQNKTECKNLNTNLPFCTNCGGDCLPDQNGWYPRGDYLSTGRGTGQVDVALIWPNIEIDDESGDITVTCSMDCRLQGSSQTAAWDDCYLTMTVENSTDIVDTFDCTTGTDTERSGKTKQTVSSTLLPMGVYKLTASFHQRDKAQSNHFEGRIYDIAVTGVATGGAKSCKECPEGYVVQIDAGKHGRCVPCGPGQQSTEDHSQCVPCPNGQFSASEGQQCKPCGASTTVRKDAQGRAVGCSVGTCSFKGQISGRTYDIFNLGRKDGDMLFAGQTPQWSGAPHNFYINPCYTEHSDQSCLLPNNDTAPYMACQTTAAGSIDIGSIFGFTEKSLGNSVLEFADGKPCYGDLIRHTTVQLKCDVNAGVGTPTKLPNAWQVETSTCHYELEWKSEFGCPACLDADYEQVFGPCSNGVQRVGYTKITDCAGTKSQTTQKCTPASVDDVPPPKHVYIVVRELKLSAQNNVESYVDTLPSRLADALQSENVLGSDIIVIKWDRIASTVSLRVDHKQEPAAQVDAIKQKLTEILNAGTFGTLQSPVAVTEPQKSGSGTPSIAAIAVVAGVVGVLLIVLGVCFWHNRKLRYRNYQLVQASGGGAVSQLYSDEHDDDDGVNFGGAVRFTNAPPPSSYDDEDDFSFRS